MTIEAVIGANYGDEGKGLFTEYLCRSRPNPLVILSNGGSQRGHTVNNVEKNIRHVFHHFGSGTLLSVPSIYSKTFLLNPITYIEEKQNLEKDGIKPIAFRAPSCILQLPCDMFTNQIIEKARGFGKHGSCGWGIWETKVRNKDYNTLSFQEFASYDFQKKKTTYLDCLEWQIENRLRGVYEPLYIEELKYVKDDNFINHFIQDFEQMEKDVRVLDNDNLLEADLDICKINIETFIVENGQGLLLDKKYAPIDSNGRTDVHSTPSYCGMIGVVEALGCRLCTSNIVANYISRTYFTRHGAGPFPEEDQKIRFEDKTNIPNKYQEALKFGSIDETSAAQLLTRIAFDAVCNGYAAKAYNLIMTHCNEIEPYRSLKNNAKFFSYDDDSKKVVKA